eukprot:XP_014013428.1 PREDICTED: uncharacterized protein LOC106578791 [Salmo salar]
MNTHVIRPRTQASALSVSSDSVGDTPASIHSVCSRTQLAARPCSGGAMRSGSGARGTSTNRPAGTWSQGPKGSFSESLGASSQLSDTHTDSIHTKNSRSDRGYSVDTHTDSIHTKNSRSDRGYSVDTCISTDYNSSPESHKAEDIEEELTEERGEEPSEEAGEELTKETGELAKESIDELGSLGFSNEYQHVSELVVNKLPGYTF